MKKFEGSGGGGGSETTNSPDTLYGEDVLEVVLAWGEGPIRGLQKGAQSFFVGTTPVVAADGVTKNFEKFAIGVHPGYPEGQAKPIDLMLGGLASSSSVGVVLLHNVAVNRQTDAVLRNTIDELEVRIIFNQLYKTTDKGSFSATAMFRLEYKPASSGDWADFYSSATVSLTGKTTAGYPKEFRVSVPRINDDWLIRVTKLNLDASQDTDSSPNQEYVTMTWDSFQQTTKGSPVFPDTALVHIIGVANGQFSSLPDFGAIVDGRLISVPTNYNPDLRTYDESTPWNGTFKQAWTQNPAWITYDLIMNTRYGLAAHRPYINADRFRFYAAAKWCDTTLLSGRPRYTYNDVIQEVRPAQEQLAYVAGSFNALVYDDNNGNVHLLIDKDDPAVMVFTPESVQDNGTGGFEYSYTDIASRANDITVTFINPDLDWNEDQRRIPNITTNEEAIAKFGRIPMDFIAVGCTNATEAIRKAAVRLVSSLTETTIVSFNTARQGALLSVYDVILVSDPTMGWAQSGRVAEVTEEAFFFRDRVYIETMQDYVVKVQTYDGVVNVTVRPASIGFVNSLRLLTPFPKNIPELASFVIEQVGDIGLAKPFRVTSIEENQDGYSYSITATEINRNKYVDADELLDLPEYQYSYKDPAVVPTPINFKLQGGSNQALTLPTGEVVNRIMATWQRPPSSRIVGFELQFKPTVDAEWSASLEARWEQAFISPVLVDTSYDVRIRTVSSLPTAKSPWVQSTYVAEGKTRVPDPVTFFNATGKVFQNLLSWGYGPARDLIKVEIWGGSSNIFSEAVKLTDLSYPTSEWTHLGLGVDVTLYYWIRIQNSSGIYSAFTGPATATTVRDPSTFLDLLTGQLTDSQLSADLLERIDTPPDLGNLTAQVNRVEGEVTALKEADVALTQGLTQEIQDRKGADTALNQGLISQAEALAQEVIDRGTAVSNETTLREEGQAHLAQDVKYVTAMNDIALAAIKVTNSAFVTADEAGVTRTELLVARINDNTTAVFQDEVKLLVKADEAQAQRTTELSATVDQNFTVYQNKVTALTQEDQALGESINSLSTTVGENYATVQEQVQVLTTKDTALAEQISTLGTSVGESNAVVQQKLTALAEADAAQVQATTQLSTKVDDNFSTYQSKVEALTQADAAQVQATTQLSTKVDANYATVQDQITVLADEDQSLVERNEYLAAMNDIALAAIKVSSSTQVTADSANVTRTELLVARVNATTEAAFQDEVKLLVKADLAQAERTTQLSTKVDNNFAAYESKVEALTQADAAQVQATTQLSATFENNKAIVDQKLLVLSDADSTQAQQISTLSTTVGQNTAAIQTVNTVVNGPGGLYAQNYVKTDVNGYVAGYGLYNSGITSQFIVRVDTFAVGTPGKANAYPFIVGLVNGQSLVGINGALAVDGSISARKLTITTVDELTPNLGYITGGAFNINNRFVVQPDGTTSISSGPNGGMRVSISATDPTYVFWVGTGAMTDANAIMYVKRNGDSYFGGSLSAGILRTAVTNPTIGSTQLINGPFGSRGNQITVVCSINQTVRRASDNHTYSVSGPAPYASLVLYRTLQGQGEVELQRSTIVGSVYIENTGAWGEESTASQTINGSFTIPDPVLSAANHTYRLTVELVPQTIIANRVSGRPEDEKETLVGQALTIVTTEP